MVELNVPLPAVSQFNVWVGLVDQNSVEISASGYKRVQVTISAETGKLVNDVWFPAATANWGVVSGFAIFAKEASAEPLLLGQLRQEHAVCVGMMTEFKKESGLEIEPSGIQAFRAMFETKSQDQITSPIEVSDDALAELKKKAATAVAAFKDVEDA